jgi:hypothetical protein
MTDRVATQCDMCGQTDDHPKVHLGEVTKHHDCLTFTEEAQVRESSETAAKIIDECKAGKRGPDLLKRIDSLHKGK